VSDEDRMLFLKYALPCAGWYVYIKQMTQEHLDDLVSQVSCGKVPKEDAESIFKVAKFHCTREKGHMDAETIRNYFLFDHNKHVEEMEALAPNKKHIDSRTYPGKVLEVNEESAVVATSNGKKEYKTAFAKEVKEGDRVVVHYDFIIEKISDETARKMEALQKKGPQKLKTGA
jgi:hydrogenase maturation factor